MCGLFHGGDSLCDHQLSTPIVPNEMGEGLWEEDICLNIKICDIPRMARLCFSVVAIGQNSKKGVKLKTKQTPIAWANTNIFDFKNILKTGSITLSMWNYEQEVEDSELELFNPLGTVVPNPSVDQATCLTITFNKYSEGELQIAYPSINDISRESFLGKTLTGAQEEEKSNEESSSRRSRHASKQFLEQLKEICDRDLLHKMIDQERELLWFLREDCRTLLPHSLNKLLISFKWNNQKTVAQVLVLLQEWPKLTPEKALELLDYPYADSMVRTFAIECLKGIFELNDHFL
jgi:phosphatidylinositol-4,5-bisphosphate 3-kinase